MIRILYSLILYLAIPAILLRMQLRARKNPAYTLRWKERFGFIKPMPTKQPVIWVHSVSVGETIASAPVVKAMMARYPEHRFVVTTTTLTGSERVKALFGDTVDHVYCPYDLPDALSRFLNRTRSELAMMMETELWPNMISACQRRHIPVLIANARLSEKSAKGYKKLGSLTRNMMRNITMIACQNAYDAERFEQLGVPTDRLNITGSVKFDISPEPAVLAQAQNLRAAWEHGLGRTAKILIAASTHEGEDQPVIDAFKTLLGSHDDSLLVLVPRHPERFNAVYHLIRSNGLDVIRHSQTTATNPNTQVILGDTMGELMKLYATADVSFVGGSFVENGGHNMLEPAALGIPVISGPSVFNFADISERLQQADGMKVVKNSDELAGATNEILTSEALHTQMSGNAKAFVAQNQGATKRILEIVDSLIKHHP